MSFPQINTRLELEKAHMTAKFRSETTFPNSLGANKVDHPVFPCSPRGDDHSAKSYGIADY